MQVEHLHGMSMGRVRACQCAVLGVKRVAHLPLNRWHWPMSISVGTLCFHSLVPVVLVRVFGVSWLRDFRYMEVHQVISAMPRLSSASSTPHVKVSR